MSTGRPDAAPWWASSGGEPREDPPRPAAGHRHSPASNEACRTCPVCSILRAVGATRPELVEHLTEAARHLALAAKAIIDAQVDNFADSAHRLERIPLDDEDSGANGG